MAFLAACSPAARSPGARSAAGKTPAGRWIRTVPYGRPANWAISAILAAPRWTSVRSTW